MPDISVLPRRFRDTLWRRLDLHRGISNQAPDASPLMHPNALLKAGLTRSLLLEPLFDHVHSRSTASTGYRRR